MRPEKRKPSTGEAFTDLKMGMTRTVAAKKVRKSSPSGNKTSSCIADLTIGSVRLPLSALFPKSCPGAAPISCVLHGEWHQLLCCWFLLCALLPHENFLTAFLLDSGWSCVNGRLYSLDKALGCSSDTLHICCPLLLTAPEPLLYEDSIWQVCLMDGSCESSHYKPALL